MPSIRSSTRSDTELTLFANEQRHIAGACQVCDWLVNHAPDDRVQEMASEAANGLRGLLSVLLNGKVQANDKK